MKLKFNIDEAVSRGKQLKRNWSFGFNTCHAALWLRKDLPAQADEMKRLGFQYVRFHNTISSYTGIYSENEQGQPQYDFTRFDAVFDRVLATGYYPFFEISYCPELLSPEKKSFLYYECYNNKPVDYEKWDALIEAIARHAVARYGLECVRKWYFEVWNEPDIAFESGQKEAYFELYDHTVLAVRRADNSLRVGGPATSKCLWIPEFIEHIVSGSAVSGGKPVPCDFISTHCYPSDLAFLPSDVGDVKLQNSNIMRQMFSSVRACMDASPLRELPLIMGEWNSSAGPMALNHDEKNNAAFIVKIFDELRDVIDGSLYWNMSDIYEEQGFHYIPFHGGYGLINVNGIPKSSYRAFELLNMLSGLELPAAKENAPESLGAIAAYDPEQGCAEILVYNYAEPDDPCPRECALQIELLGGGALCAQCDTLAITDKQGSAYEWWRAVGSPDFLDLDTLQFLMKKSQMAQAHSLLLRDGQNAPYRVEANLAPGDVQLFRIRL